MTKNARSQQSTGKTLRQSRDASIACAEGGDVCELLLAELQDRRVRLKKLLNLLCMELERLSPRRAALPSRPKCQSVRLDRTAA
jgi:hypothetical protein